jgi:hypothetical protein
VRPDLRLRLHRGLHPRHCGCASTYPEIDNSNQRQAFCNFVLLYQILSGEKTADSAKRVKNTLRAGGLNFLLSDLLVLPTWYLCVFLVGLSCTAICAVLIVSTGGPDFFQEERVTAIVLLVISFFIGIWTASGYSNYLKPGMYALTLLMAICVSEEPGGAARTSQTNDNEPIFRTEGSADGFGTKAAQMLEYYKDVSLCCLSPSPFIVGRSGASYTPTTSQRWEPFRIVRTLSSKPFIRGQARQHHIRTQICARSRPRWPKCPCSPPLPNRGPRLPTYRLLPDRASSVVLVPLPLREADTAPASLI